LDDSGDRFRGAKTFRVSALAQRGWFMRLINRQVDHRRPPILLMASIAMKTANVNATADMNVLSVR
jgi:hypothetical protein